MQEYRRIGEAEMQARRGETGAFAESRSLAPAPARLLTGPDALDKVARRAARAGDRVLAVSGHSSWEAAKEPVVAAFDGAGLALEVTSYGRHVSETEIERLCLAARGMDAIVGVGGGKALDAAKLVAHQIGVPVFNIPTSAATCAAWTALSNVYSEQGGWLYGVPLDRAPEAVAMDYRLIEAAGPRLLASGVADAMAKWYESESSVDPGSADALTLAAVEMAHHLHKQLVRHAKGAVVDLGRGRSTDSLRRVIDANITLAGVVGGLGGSKCRSVAAHAVANGLTHVDPAGDSFHGEKVGFGIVVQLVLLDRPLQEIEELIAFFGELGIPLSLSGLLGGAAPDLGTVADIALHHESGIHKLPIPLDSVTLIRAIEEADALARRLLQQNQLERALRPIL